MATSNLRRANQSEQSEESAQRKDSPELVDIVEIESERVVPVCEDYPFEQDRHVGTATYIEPSEFTPGREIEIEFEYRDESELLRLELKTDVDSVNKIFEEIAPILGSGLEVYHNIHAPEDALWDFLMEANRILEITVFDEGYEVPYDDIEGVPREDVIGEYAIESATVGFNHDGHQIVVQFTGGKLQIETDWDAGREYILQLFEREVLAG